MADSKRPARPASYALLLLLLAAAPAYGQAVVIPPAAEPRLPGRGLPVPEVELELSIPAQPRAPDRRAVDELVFPISRIAVEGSTVYSEAQLSAFTAPLIGRSLGLSAITAVAEAIENRYRTDGYVLSRVFVPPQRVGDGTFRIQIVEGFLSQIEFDGGSDAARERIRGYLRRAFEGRPANLAAIERGLLLAGDLAGVSAAGTLAPGQEPGSSNLLVRIEEKPLQASATASNRASKFQGPVTVYAETSFNGLLGMTEQITVGGSTVPSWKSNRELRQGVFRYTQPIGDDGLVFGWDTTYSWGWPGHTLKALQVHTTAWRLGPRLSYPVIRSRRVNLVFDTSAYVSRTATFVRGDPLSRDRYLASDARVTFSHLGFLQGATVLSAGVTRGLIGLGTENPNDLQRSRSDAQPQFTKFTGEIRRIQLLTDDFSAQWTFAGQVTRNRLYSGEEFSLGGGRFGRGYDPSEITGVNGAGSALDIRYGDLGTAGWQPYVFYDYGWAWNRRGSGASFTQTLASVGLGVKLAPENWLSSSFELAQPLTRVPSLTEDRKPLRIYWDISMRF
ncbi:MAG: ShlB/FhaC/HecB family hemolysin secretion/activation protein [Rhodospirillales bacterium]|nr:ShlB/FhaC/HecB family hemolysin secretion/activation protein [Rhodospirillales bacterium]